MLIIGHRGAAGLAPENTLEALAAGIKSGADILEFDIRLTKDGVPVLVHDFHTLRTERRASIIGRSTLAQLRQRTKNSPIVTLEEALDVYFGVVMLNIEFKSFRVTRVAMELIKSKYIKKPSDWDKLLLSSFQGRALKVARRIAPEANLAILQGQNPFIFVAYARSLDLVAVGFHRLYVNPLALEIAKKAGLFTYAYTVDRPRAAYLLSQQGVDAVVTDHPDRIIEQLKRYN